MGRSAAHSTSVPQRVAGAVVAAGTTALLAGVLVPALGGRAVQVRDGRTAGHRHGAVRDVGVAVRAAVAAAAGGAGRRLRGVADARARRAGRGRMIHLGLPLALVAVLAGAGVYGVLARRNAVLVLIGVELLLNAANLLFVTVGAVSRRPAARPATSSPSSSSPSPPPRSASRSPSCSRCSAAAADRPHRAGRMSELLQASARLAVLLPAVTAVLALAAARRPRLATGLATAGAVPDPAGVASARWSRCSAGPWPRVVTTLPAAAAGRPRRAAAPRGRLPVGGRGRRRRGGRVRGPGVQPLVPARPTPAPACSPPPCRCSSRRCCSWCSPAT